MSGRKRSTEKEKQARFVAELMEDDDFAGLYAETFGEPTSLDECAHNSKLLLQFLTEERGAIN